MLKRVVRGAGWTVVGLLGLVLVLGLALVLVNLRDEPLDPRAIALLATAPARWPEAQNGFPDFVGLKAPAGADARAWGRQWLAEAAKVTDGDRAAAFQAKFGDAKTGRIETYCNPVVTSCLTKIAQARPATVAAVDVHGELLERYRRLFDYPGMEETYEPVSPSTPIITFQGAFAAQALHLARVALKVGDKDLRGAVDLLERDVALQRRLMAGARFLITKLIATEMFTRDMALLSDLMRQRRSEMASLAGRVAALAAPLSGPERSMAQVFASEFRWQGNFLLQLMRSGKRDEFGFLGVPGFLAPWVYQPNATVNLQYRLFEPVLTMDPLAPPANPVPKTPPAELTRTWTLPYNYLGKMILRVATPDFSDHPNRIGDVDGLTRLVRLQAAVVAHGVGNDRVAPFVAEQDRAVANPYTGQPMSWDAQVGQLGFEPRSTKWRNQRFGGKPNWLAITL